MNIHTVKSGETVYSIAREYGVSPTKLLESNGLLPSCRLTVGQQLLILIPTKTYLVKRGDTLDSLSRRFKTNVGTLMKNNPMLFGHDKLYQEEIITVSYPIPNHAPIVTNGILYAGCNRDRLDRALPYMSFMTVASHIMSSGKLKALFSPENAISNARSAGKGVLIRIYLKDEYNKESYSPIIYEIVKLIKGYKANGVSLAGIINKDSEEFCDWIFDLKKELIKENLLLCAEVGPKSAPIISSIADYTVLCYDKYSEKNIKSFEECEEKILRDYAQNAECTSTFIDLSPFAYENSLPIPITDAIQKAMQHGYEITNDKSTKSLSYRSRDGKETFFPSLENIKAKLELSGELGYLGVCFDIMRCPTEHLMCVNSTFHCIDTYYPSGPI